jgi:hypothetical protein
MVLEIHLVAILADAKSGYYSSRVDQFKSRFEWIVFATSGIGWGFLDDLTEVYSGLFDDSD